MNLTDLLNQAADDVDVANMPDPVAIRRAGDRRTARNRRRALIGAAAVAALMAAAGPLSRVGDHRVEPAPPVPTPPVLPKKLTYLDENGISFVGDDGSRRTLRANNIDRFAFTPDGQRVAYITYNTTSNWLWLADGNGTHRRRQPEPCIGCMPGYGLAWSNDGTRLAYSVFTPGKHSPAQLRIRTLGSDHEQTFRMPHGCDARGPRFSPDDQTLALNLSCGDADYVATLDPDRGASSLTRLTHGYSQVQLPSWSGDGQTVYFTATTNGDNTNDISGRGDLFAIRADGTGSRQITHAASGERFFSASPYQSGFLISRAYRKGPWKVGWLSGDGTTFTPMTGSDGKPVLGYQLELQP